MLVTFCLGMKEQYGHLVLNNSKAVRRYRQSNGKVHGILILFIFTELSLRNKNEIMNCTMLVLIN